MTAKERPILFSGPMVRAILDGRKTMTRRVAKRTASGLVKEPNGHRRWHPADPDAVAACPYGSPGDRLWVRETWGSADGMYHGHENDVPRVIAYRADKSAIDQGLSRQVPIPAWDLAQWNWGTIKWRPSIHMPRWASRITLEVTDVRLERLQDISEEDAKAEGVATRCLAEPDESPECSVGFRNPDGFALDNFRSLWDAINGAESWDANPWVWVVSFRRLQP